MRSSIRKFLRTIIPFFHSEIIDQSPSIRQWAMVTCGLSRIDLDLSRWFQFKSMRLKPCFYDVVCILGQNT